jgi:dethiobiotin synthetase
MNLHKTYFVTGTDTGIGKTYVTQKIMQRLKAQGKTVLGLKPIACGGDSRGNEDALIYLQENSLRLPYETINPFLFEAPVSPHLASRLEDKVLYADKIAARMQAAIATEVDHIFLEGAGGVHSPINNQETILDVMKALDLPVILVVGLRLGCLNHAFLSMQALKAAGLRVGTWVPNLIDPQMARVEENVETLVRWLDPLVELPYSVLGAFSDLPY